MENFYDQVGVLYKKYDFTDAEIFNISYHRLLLRRQFLLLLLLREQILPCHTLAPFQFSSTSPQIE
jgi:hypothetical protein